MIMKDFRTVIYYKSEDALDGIEFDNPNQFATAEGRFLGLKGSFSTDGNRALSVNA